MRQISGCRRIAAAGLLLSTAFVSAQNPKESGTATPTEAKPPQTQKQAPTGTDAGTWTPPPGFYDDRIVAPKKVKRSFSLAPDKSSSSGNAIERGLDYVEDSNGIQRVMILLSDPNVRPLFGNLGDGSGIGGGLYLSTADSISEKFEIFGLGHVTTKRYLQGQAGIRLKPWKSLGEKLAISFTSELRLLTQEDFWGSGPDPARTRTNYDLQRRGIGADLTYRPNRWWRMGTALVYDSTSVFAGRDDRFPTTQSIFSPGNTPGLLEGAALLAPAIFAEFDARRGKNAPVRGFYSYAAIASNDSVGRGDFGFWSYLVDSRFYVPLLSDARVLAARTLLQFNDPKGGSQIPFFRQARLGDSQTLRGYDSQRFYANNAAAWNVEYRNDLTGGIGAFAFTDFGQVFNSRSEFNTRNFRVTYGGGLQFKTHQSIVLRVYLAKSEEGNRFFFTFGPTF